MSDTPQRVLLIGLDCLGPEVLDPSRGLMPHLAGLAQRHPHGVLESTLPSITVPAWTSMLTGCDPGELGLYGFRNRRSFAYDDLVLATSNWVRRPRIWDRLTDAGRPSLVVGLPQTSPPPPLLGHLVCGFEGPVKGRYTYPESFAVEVEAATGGYLFDVSDFRRAALDQVIETAYAMTERRFLLMRRLLATKPWSFALLHEIGADRIHHCFWRFHDPRHPRHEPNSPFTSVVRDYYRFLDAQVKDLIDQEGSTTAVLVASDHGVTPMDGGVCVNEVLRDAGLLRLRVTPPDPVRLRPDMVRWEGTTAWAEGGYYARIFLNVRGREPQGIVPPGEMAAARRRVAEALATIALPDGRVLQNRVVEPARLYREVRGIPPDLFVFFQDERWRSVGSVGMGAHVVTHNDTGADGANHTRAGMFVLAAPGMGPSPLRRASILDVAPTLLRLLGLAADPRLQGRALADEPLEVAAR